MPKQVTSEERLERLAGKISYVPLFEQKAVELREDALLDGDVGYMSSFR